MSNFIDVEKQQADDFERVFGEAENSSYIVNGNFVDQPSDDELFKNCPEAQNNENVTPKQKQGLNNKKITALHKLKALSTSGRIDIMKNELGNEVHVFEGLALEGQLSLFFAWPNTGKTLIFFHLLIERIKQGLIDPNNIFYINADDDYRGLVKKGELAEQYGFEMINPAEAGMSTNEVIQMLLELANSPDSKGKIIILDTVKKFVNLMSKHEQAKFYSDMRILAINGMTVIMAGHANKYPNAEGEIIYEGTADTLNDIDCVFSINRMSPLDSNEMIVEFRKVKSRGDVAKKMSFKYNNRLEATWGKKLNSVTLLAGKAASTARYEKLKIDKIKKYESAKLFVSELLKEKSLNQSEITQKHTEYTKNSEHEISPLACEISVRQLKTALKQLDGIVWKTSRGIKHNELIYTLIDTDGSRYKACKNGE